MGRAAVREVSSVWITEGRIGTALVPYSTTAGPYEKRRLWTVRDETQHPVVRRTFRHHGVAKWLDHLPKQLLGLKAAADRVVDLPTCFRRELHEQVVLSLDQVGHEFEIHVDELHGAGRELNDIEQPITFLSDMGANLAGDEIQRFTPVHEAALERNPPQIGVGKHRYAASPRNTLEQRIRVFVKHVERYVSRWRLCLFRGLASRTATIRRSVFHS